ncbi:SDR family NAD(P)-dependent oxidoreductase [Sphingobium fuliginis]|uniref:3-oxoacyl-[acyl-carrier protein] reductase n=1 Tax=Sphingobium fuliginis (strain ATCC 27551) TaxID=336203 RepID=A0A292ZFS1_SPHSA|nr:SDR family NAD(P)-dependent oxidoreductase [Sphingobium fuliginis]GAY21746.1 3-oxoacyl-[acyl-carrier protein] reductase [Sphingobium fuliginis]
MSEAKHWLITGISSGIGAALADAALERGDSVVGTARSDEDVAKFNDRAPGRSKAVRLDVTNPTDVEKTIAAIIADGPLDIVVNNAGQSIYGAFEETSIAEAKALFDVNLFGPWALAQAVLPHFREKRAGHLIHMSSGCGLNGTPGLSAYCASKFALEGLSEALSYEAAQFGIKLLIVEPGAVATKFISHGTRETAQRMPEYGFLSGDGKAALEGYYATCAASPESVAQAVLRAIENPETPLRLIVGDDMRDPVRAKGEQLLSLANA